LFVDWLWIFLDLILQLSKCIVDWLGVVDGDERAIDALADVHEEVLDAVRAADEFDVDVAFIALQQVLVVWHHVTIVKFVTFDDHKSTIVATLVHW